MRNSSSVPHYSISSRRYSTREFNTGAEPFMVAMIIIIIIIIVWKFLWSIFFIWFVRTRLGSAAALSYGLILALGNYSSCALVGTVHFK